MARDDTTRYLCAAAHLDDDYADGAIREFLVEGTRPVPPSLGVDAAAVLGEAVAARTRRKLRDTALILLTVAFVVLAPATFLIRWFQFAALLFILPRLISSRKNRKPKWKTWLLVAVTVIMTFLFGPLLILFLVTPLIIIMPSAVELSYGIYYADYLDVFPLSFGSVLLYFDTGGIYFAESSGVGVEAILSAIVIGLMLGVLFSDQVVVWRHLDQRFWRRAGAISLPPIHQRAVYQLSPGRFVRNLTWYVNPQPTMANPPSATANDDGSAGPAPVIVYRGFNPFVGAGQPYEPWSIAVPLEPLEDVAEPRKLTTEALYAAIGAEVDRLRWATPLTPSRRLATMRVGEQIIVTAHELIDHLAEPSTADFLGGTKDRPYTMLRGERVQAVKADPLEWARYYQCYQIETWDRDFVVSVFVHVAVADGTLYVEWTPCVLLPIKRKYQEIDAMSRSPLLPIGRSLLQLVQLPASIPGRLAKLFSLIRPLSQGSRQINPNRYGSLLSLRELAADDDVHNYFQLADVDRYQKTLESRFVLAVSHLLREAGYSTASFDQQAATVINGNVQIGPVSGGNLAIGSRVGRMTAGAPTKG